ncbi:MAG TPA: hypothetical protein PKD83_06450 [Ignavibacteria bacterium]|nr:hypothetical protein [Ignavibacteria bacterium]
MAKTGSAKFIRIYQTFSAKEKKEFRLYIKSPLIKNNRDYTKWLDRIDKSKDLIQKNFEEKNRSTIWNRLSELTALAEKFLIIKGLEKNEYYKDKLLLDQLFERKILNIFSFKCDKFIEKVKTSPVEYESAKQLSELYFMKSKSHLIKNDFEGISESYSLCTEYLITGILINIYDKLKEIHFQKTNNVGHSKSVFDELINSINIENYLRYLEKAGSQYYYFVLLSYTLYKFICGKSDLNLYLKAVEIFNTKMNNISGNYKHYFYFDLINFGIHLRNNKILKNDNVLFSLFDKKLKEGLNDDLNERDYSLNRFGDYVIIALNLDKIKWVENFIKKYSQLLPQKFRDDEVNMALSLLEFKKRNYAKSLEHQKNIKKSNHVYYILTSKLFLKTNFLMGNYEECFQAIERMKKFSMKYKNSPYNLINTTPYLIKVFKALLKYKYNPDKKNITELEFLINSKENFTEKKWILEVYKSPRIKMPKDTAIN